MLKPHDLRHGVAMKLLEQHHDLEAMRAMLGHTRIDTTQTDARIRPAELKRAVEFLRGESCGGDEQLRRKAIPSLKNLGKLIKPGG